MRHPKTKSQPKPKSKEAERIPAADVSLIQGPLSEGFQRDLETADGKDSALVKKVANVVLSIVHQEIFSGPLPHPNYLAEYDQIHPGAADRIIAMVLLLLAYVSSQAGHQAVAIAFLAASTVGMAASFIKGRSWLTDRTPEQAQTTEPKKK